MWWRRLRWAEDGWRPIDGDEGEGWYKGVIAQNVWRAGFQNVGGIKKIYLLQMFEQDVADGIKQLSCRKI